MKNTIIKTTTPPGGKQPLIQVAFDELESELKHMEAALQEHSEKIQPVLRCAIPISDDPGQTSADDAGCRIATKIFELAKVVSAHKEQLCDLTKRIEL